MGASAPSDRVWFLYACNVTSSIRVANIWGELVRAEGCHLDEKWRERGIARGKHLKLITRGMTSVAVPL